MTLKKNIFEINTDIGYSRQFANEEEILKWVKSEQSYWQWSGTVWQNIHHIYTNLENIVTALINGTKEWSSTQEEIENYYLNNTIIDSGSPKGEFINELKAQNPATAIFACQLLLNLRKMTDQPNYNNINNFDWLPFISGVTLANLFIGKQKGLNITAEKKSLKNMVDENLRIFQDIKNNMNNIIESEKARVIKFKEENDNVQNKIQELHVRQEVQLADITKTYLEKMKLLAPVEYWKNKRKNHWILAVAFSIVVFISGGLSGIFIYKTVNPTFEYMAQYLQELHKIEDPKNPQNISKYEKPIIPVSAFTLFVVIVTMLFWLIKILIKLIVSNIHLANDADERIVLLQTYISLIDDKYAKEDDRKIILEHIFRHSAIGLIKDESLNTPIESIMKSLKQ